MGGEITFDGVEEELAKLKLVLNSILDSIPHASKDEDMLYKIRQLTLALLNVRSSTIDLVEYIREWRMLWFTDYEKDPIETLQSFYEYSGSVHRIGNFYNIVVSRLVKSMINLCKEMRKFPDMKIFIPDEWEKAIHFISSRSSIIHEFYILSVEYIPLRDHNFNSYIQEVEKQLEGYAQEYLVISEKLLDIFWKLAKNFKIYKIKMREINMDKIKSFSFKNIANSAITINVEGLMLNTINKIENSKLPETKKNEWKALLEELKDGLSKIKEENAENVKIISNIVDTISTEIIKPKPNKKFLKITINGLFEASKTIAVLWPTITAISEKIADFISRF